VLMLCPEAPYPVLGGGAQRMASIIEYFTRSGCAVDVVSFVPCQAPAGAVREMLAVPLPPNRRSLAARVMRNAGRLVRGVPPLVDRLSGFQAELRRVLGDRRYDIAILEHFWLAPYVELAREFAQEVWCDLHNIESRFFGTLAGASPFWQGLAHLRFASLSRQMEQALLPRFDRLLVCSDVDLGFVDWMAPGVSKVVYPNTIAWRERMETLKEPAIVFSGNMEYHPNLSAVNWFFKAAWPRIREARADVVWRLVGMNPQAVAGIVAGDARVHLVGPVEDAVAEIARAQVAIVPVHAGSGTRVKILEAWAAPTAVVTTPLGVQGLPEGRAVRVAGQEQFAEAVLEVLDSERVRTDLETAGREIYESKFHREAGWKLLDEAGIV
jgi:polysaccharide biosynthesis protein PslH